MVSRLMGMTPATTLKITIISISKFEKRINKYDTMHVIAVEVKNLAKHRPVGNLDECTTLNLYV